MQAQFDPTDIQTVSAEDLALPMKLLISEGHALVLFNAGSKTARDAIDTAFWRSFKGQTQHGAAILLRFWCLIDVLATRRLNQRMLDRGFALIAPLTDVAAKLRLNANWGFNPQRVLAALIAAELAAAAVTVNYVETQMPMAA